MLSCLRKTGQKGKRKKKLSLKSLDKMISDIQQELEGKEDQRVAEEAKEHPNEGRLEKLDQEIDLLEKIREGLEEYIEMCFE